MKDKLKEYIDTIFADAERRSPHNERLGELKEEMLQNLNEKYDDLIAAGRSPASAYNSAIAGVGDISALLDSISGVGAAPESTGEHRSAADSKRPPEPLTPEQESRLRKYRGRSAVMTAIAIAMYILCVVPAIILGDDIVGPVLMFVMIAVATSLLIFNGMTKPKFDRTADGEDGDDDEDHADNCPVRSPVYKAISGAIWMLGVCAYLFVSFTTWYWHITWMIFLILTAVDNIIRAIFDLRR